MRESENDLLSVVAGGVTIFEALKAYEHLKELNISIRVIDIFSVKPVDRENLIKHATLSKNKILVVEDHYQ